MGVSKKRQHQTKGTPQDRKRHDRQPKDDVHANNHFHHFSAKDANGGPVDVPRNAEEAAASYFNFVVNQLPQERPKQAEGAEGTEPKTGQFCCAMGGTTARHCNDCGCVYTWKEALESHLPGVTSWAELVAEAADEDSKDSIAAEEIQHLFLKTATLATTMLKLVQDPQNAHPDNNPWDDAKRHYMECLAFAMEELNLHFPAHSNKALVMAVPTTLNGQHGAFRVCFGTLLEFLGMETGPRNLICKLIRMGFPGWQTRRTFRFLKDKTPPAFQEFAPKMSPQEVDCTRFTHLWQMDRHKSRMLLSALVTLLEQVHVGQRVLFHPTNHSSVLKEIKEWVSRNVTSLGFVTTAPRHPSNWSEQERNVHTNHDEKQAQTMEKYASPLLQALGQMGWSVVLVSANIPEAQQVCNADNPCNGAIDAKVIKAAVRNNTKKPPPTEPVTVMHLKGYYSLNLS